MANPSMLSTEQFVITVNFTLRMPTGDTFTGTPTITQGTPVGGFGVATGALMSNAGFSNTPQPTIFATWTAGTPGFDYPIQYVCNTTLGNKVGWCWNLNFMNCGEP